MVAQHHESTICHELNTSKWFALCYVNFMSIIFLKKKGKKKKRNLSFHHTQHSISNQIINTKTGHGPVKTISVPIRKYKTSV